MQGSGGDEETLPFQPVRPRLAGDRHRVQGLGAAGRDFQVRGRQAGDDLEAGLLPEAKRRRRHVVLGLDPAREPVAGRAADALRPLRIVEVDRHRQGKRFEAEPFRGRADAPGRRGEVDRGPGVGSGPRRLAGVGAGLPVNGQQVLGLGVVRFELVVGDRPLLEIGFPQAQGGPPEKDRVAADHLVGIERLGFFGPVLAHRHRGSRSVPLLDQDFPLGPVPRVPARPAAALDQEGLQPGADQAQGGAGPAEPGTDDDGIVFHESLRPGIRRKREGITRRAARRRRAPRGRR